MLADFFAKRFIKNHQDIENSSVRDSYANMANVFFMVMMGSMGVVKFLIGSMVGSLAITSSSFADFADIGLAVMMMISFRLAAKAPDAKHPFGYARIEYITGMVVSLVVFLLGINLLTSSVNKIMHPTAPEATIPAYIIMLVSVAINVVVYSVNRRVGKIIQSVAISAAATKNIIDGIASFVVVCALGVFSLWGVDLDGYVGLMMSLLIIYSAATSLRDTVNPLLGLVPNLEFSREITDKILAYPQVLGVHDQIIHNYGNNRCYISAHVELSQVLSNEEIHQIICDIEQDFLFEGIRMTLHFDLSEKEDAQTAHVLAELNRICETLSHPVAISDLKLMPSEELLYLFFTITIPRGSQINGDILRKELQAQLQKLNQNYTAAIRVNYSHVLL